MGQPRNNIQEMKFVKILFAFCQIESRSIFPKPRPTTLGFHPELPSLLIPVPLFTFGPGETEEQSTSTEIVPDPTTTFEFTTEYLTTGKVNELTTTSSTAPPTASSAPTISMISWTATIQNDVILTSTTSTTSTLEASTSSTTTATSLSDETDLSDRFFSAWDTAKEIGSIVLVESLEFSVK